jgi:UDP-N-acetylmuramoyl-L-alanyl-D-glutamate--2,6-diaminopimelate ligase
VINLDDAWGRKLAAVSKGSVLTYGLGPDAALRAGEISMTVSGTEFTLTLGGESARVSTALVGSFNVSNILAAVGTGLGLGLPFAAAAADVAAFRPVRGRFEPIVSPRGWTVIVDYAHTPDALRKTLEALREAFPRASGGRILTVFGCGGNRDRSKRPEMGRIAAGHGDVTIITSDNPRDEEPEAIIDEIAAGIGPGSEVLREADRAKAIRMALAMAAKGDVVLIAGKGHEEYQVVGGTRIPFSDARVAEEAIRGMK